ncbi:SigE family RNA polymerase sigma factor [soil metagenome]
MTIGDERPIDLRPGSFEAFYKLAWDEIYRSLAITVGDADLAREAVDEAMTRAYARWRTVGELSNPNGWVFRVAYRWSIDRLRRRGTERRLLPRLAVMAGRGDPWVEPGPESALMAIPREQRLVVVLACVHDWSEHNIAEALGVRPGTVKSRLHRGLARLREELEK